jgi:hypothetical protein
MSHSILLAKEVVTVEHLVARTVFQGMVSQPELFTGTHTCLDHNSINVKSLHFVADALVVHMSASEEGAAFLWNETIPGFATLGRRLGSKR